MKSMNDIISTNLKAYRKKFKLSQEQVAEEIGVSRQALAKWEAGETLPDLENCQRLVELYKTTFDTLIADYSDNKSAEKSGGALKDSYFFGIAKVGERGQIVIPKGARKVYNITPGDRLLVVGDKRGLGIGKLKGILPFDTDDN